MDPREQKRRLEIAEKLTLKRIESMAGGTIACEYSGCNCLVKTQISVTTMSVIVMPTLDEIQLVCQGAAVDFARKNNLNLNS